MMNWEQLLSLKRQGDKGKRLRVEQDDTRLGFEVDYDRIIFLRRLEVYKIKHKFPLSKTDFVHTRLHSLEVLFLGRLVGKLSKNPHLKTPRLSHE
jgi:dGTPase